MSACKHTHTHTHPDRQTPRHRHTQTHAIYSPSLPLRPLTGTSGNKSTLSGGEDDSLGTANSSQALVEKLGQEKRNEVLALVYFLRRDTQARVREAALHIWKVLVDHALRTLREVMPELMMLVFSSLAMESEVRQGTALRTLGELVRKMGDKLMTTLVPMMRDALKGNTKALRIGVCYGLCEVLLALSNEQARTHILPLVPAFKRAIVDADPEVRDAAGHAFNFMVDRMGNTVVEQIVPLLVEEVAKGGGSEHALAGLEALMKYRAKAVLPLLVSQLLAGELTPAKAEALARLMAVASEGGSRHAAEVLDRLLENVCTVGEESVKEMTASLASVIAALDPETQAYAAGKLQELMQDGTSRSEFVVASVVAHVGSEATEITVGNMEVFLRLALVGLYATDSNILFLVYQALSTLCPRVKNASPMLAVLVSEVLRSMPRDEGGLIAGLRYPRMVEPIVTMYLDFVLFKDDPSVRTAMVKALGACAGTGSCCAVLECLSWVVGGCCCTLTALLHVFLGHPASFAARTRVCACVRACACVRVFVCICR